MGGRWCAVRVQQAGRGSGEQAGHAAAARGTAAGCLERWPLCLRPPCRVAAIGPGWVELDREVPFPVRPAAGWEGVVARDAPVMEDAGVQGLTIEFK